MRNTATEVVNRRAAPADRWQVTGLIFILMFTVGGIPAERASSAEMPDDSLERIGTRRQGTDWPGFLGAGRDGKSPETGLVTPWPEGGPPLVWQMPLTESYGIGSVAGGRFYQPDRRGDRAVLLCVEAETGEPIWEFAYRTDYVDAFNYNGGPRASPLIEGNRVYFYGVDGQLFCLNATTGEEMWQVDTQAQFGFVQNFFGVGSSPVISDDLLICMVGGSPPEDRNKGPASLDLVRPDGSAVVAFDKWTGEVRYRTGDDLASYASPRLATIDSRPTCFLFARGGLLAFDPDTGEEWFSFPWRDTQFESVNASTPVVVDDRVFVSEAYGIGSALLQVEDGQHEVVWQDPPRSRERSMRAHWSTPIHVDGYLYGCSGRNPADSDLRCIEWSTGEVQWVLPNRERTSLLYVDGHFIALGEGGTFFMFRQNPRTFELVSQAQYTEPSDVGPPRSMLRYPCWAAPVLSHGLLYVRGRDRLLCLEVIPANP